MSRATKRKHVKREMEADNFELPKETEQIVRIVASRGNNLHEVEPDEGENFLVSMPTKFRRNIWIKRGDFVLVEPIEEGDKVKAEIAKILSPEHIRVFTEEGIWPKKFTKKREAEDDVDEDGLVMNTNRRVLEDETDESSDDEEED